MNNFKTTKKVVKLDECIPNTWNPNSMSEQMFKKEVNSIKKLGMLGSILVREIVGCYEILDGEHRWRACKELKYTEIPVESLGKIDDNQAKMLTILLNNLRGKDDIEKRAQIFEQLEQGQLQLLPFTEEEIENEKKLFKFDFSQYQNQIIDDKEKILLVNFKVNQELYDLWHRCLEIAHKDNKTTDEILAFMFDYYLTLNDLNYNR